MAIGRRGHTPDRCQVFLENYWPDRSRMMVGSRSQAESRADIRGPKDSCGVTAGPHEQTSDLNRVLGGDSTVGNAEGLGTGASVAVSVTATTVWTLVVQHVLVGRVVETRERIIPTR